MRGEQRHWSAAHGWRILRFHIEADRELYDQTTTVTTPRES